MSAREYQKVIFRDDRAELMAQELPAPGADQVLIKTRFSGFMDKACQGADKPGCRGLLAGGLPWC